MNCARRVLVRTARTTHLPRRTSLALVVAVTAIATACSSSPPPEEAATAPPQPHGPITDPAELEWHRSAPDPAVWGADASTMVFGSTVGADGTLVAVGVDRRASPSVAAVFTSRDGIDYSRVDPRDVHTSTATLSAETAMRGVVATPAGLVAVGFEFAPAGAQVPATTDAAGAGIGATTAAVWRSADARTWDRAATVPADALAGALMTRIVALPVGGFLALGEEPTTGAGIAWTSPDAATWQRIDPGSGLDAPGRVSFQTASATSQGILVAGSYRVGDSRRAAVWRSNDAVTWQRVESPAFATSQAQEISALAMLRGTIVAGGASIENGTDAAAIWTSPDGIAWDRVTHDEDVFGGAGSDAVTVLLPAGDGILALGRSSPGKLDADAAVWTSKDARNWRREPAPTETFGGANTEEFLTAAIVADRVAATGRSKRADRDTLRYVDTELLLWFAQE
ncbi:MAG: hypothetical protein U0U69_05365 [Acidimicrobiia bacterium]